MRDKHSNKIRFCVNCGTKIPNCECGEDLTPEDFNDHNSWGPVWPFVRLEETL
jgi:hypothetical protein